ncbi:MAG: hypothetical protein ACYTXC_08230 [Nostoc sp.]
MGFSLKAEGTDDNGLRRHPSAKPKTLWLCSVEDTSKDSLPKFQSVTSNAAQSSISIASG